MRFLLVFLAALLAMPALAQPTVVSAPESQEGVSLTVYNGGFAVVRETRPIALQRGLNLVRFEGVAARIDPTSLAIKSLTQPGALTVREQNYQYDLIGTASVLNAAVGQRVRLIRTLGDQTVIEEGVLISQPGQGRIIQLDDGRILVDPSGTIELASLPTGLLSRPSLLWHLNTDRAGTHQTEVSYMTEGFSWKADYVAVINDEATQVDLTGWVTLDNQSGATYRSASLQLLAGDVRRVQEQQAYPQAARVYEMADAVGAPAFEEESFFEYHLYTLDGETTLQQRETKQMQLLSANEVGVRRRLIFDGSGSYFPFYRRSRPGAGGATNEMSAAIVVELENSEANNMGMPLPQGKVRVYQADRRGRLQFLGEDLIDHTPRNELIRLYIGDAFDVVGTRRQIANRRLSDRVTEQTYEVEVRNRKDESAEVAVVERVWGDWQVTEKSHDFTTLDSRTIEFPLTLGPDETATVRYTVRITY